VDELICVVFNPPPLSVESRFLDELICGCMNWVFDELLDRTVASASEHGCGGGGSNEHARMLYSFF
jgi:hypothetical protein